MRRAMRSGCCLLLALVAGLPASADELELDALAWMSGAWGATTAGVSAEEIWMPPRGGLMLGLHRDVADSGRTFFEYLRIEKRDAGIFYVASPRGTGSTDFRWVEAGERRAVFANDDHDWPQRITYWINEQHELCARAAGAPGSAARESEWCWAGGGD